MCKNELVTALCFAQASLAEMIAPGALVILTPVVVGTLFGTRTLAGLLSGSLVSGVQMAVSMSNTGGAWDNAKKYVEVRDFPAAHRRGEAVLGPASQSQTSIRNLLMP